MNKLQGKYKLQRVAAVELLGVELLGLKKLRDLVFPPCLLSAAPFKYLRLFPFTCVEYTTREV